MMKIIRTLRNWPKKIISLHKTERKISDLHNLIIALKEEIISSLKEKILNSLKDKLITALKEELIPAVRNELITVLKNENTEIRNNILELKHRLPVAANNKTDWEKIYYKNIINMGEMVSSTPDKNNIFRFIKKYFDDIGSDDFQFVIDFATDYQTGSFSDHHYSIDAFRKRIKPRADEFLDELHSSFLHPRQLEITANHSISRTFRFWSQDEKKTYMQFANHVMQTLKELSEYVCLGYGAVLAAQRTGHLIPHDDDVDILLYLPRRFDGGRAEAVKYVKNFLDEKGIRTAKKDWGTHVKTSSPEKGVLDVFVAIENNGLLDWIPGPRECFSFDTVFPPRKMPLEGIQCDIPADTDNYLCTLYGPDWRIPDKNFHHV